MTTDLLDQSKSAQPLEQIGATTGGEPGETVSQVPGLKAADGPLSSNQGEEQVVVALQEQN